MTQVIFILEGKVVDGQFDYSVVAPFDSKEAAEMYLKSKCQIADIKWEHWAWGWFITIDEPYIGNNEETFGVAYRLTPYKINRSGALNALELATLMNGTRK